MLTGKDYEKFCDQLVEHEGLRLNAYLDTAKPPVLTIGVGHNCKTSPVPGVSKVGDSITMQQAMELFDKDITQHNAAALKAIPWIEDLNPPRQAVLYNMAFNLGITGLLGFKNTLGMIREEKYSSAAAGMMNSKWATQVGRRARTLSDQMETGEWQGV